MGREQTRLGIRLKPITFKQASAFIKDYHRHHSPARGWKYGVSVVNDEGDLVGVGIAGRPVSRILDDGTTLEVIRCCTTGTKNVASMLYGALWRAAKALGYRKMVTYILTSETGTSLKAAGWVEVADIRGKSWNSKQRRRVDKHPTGDKVRYEVAA